MSAGAALTAVIVLVAVPILASCAGDDARPGATSPSVPVPAEEGRTSLYDLRVGDCFSGLGRNQDLRVVPVRCRRPHQAEVYGLVTLDERRYPGVDTLRVQAATACAQRFAAYTGEPAGPDTAVAFTEVVPTLASWSAGDRTALCLAVGLDGSRLRGTIALGGEPA